MLSLLLYELGLLLVFAVGHFVDARQVSKEEAATAVALFNAVDPYPASNRDPLRHDLLCYMNSAATDDWSAARAGNLSGSANTEAYASSVQKKIEALPQDKDVEASNHYFVTEEILDLAKYRQLRLLHAVPEIPPVIWVVLYVSAFLFVGLTVFHLGRRRWLTRMAVAATTLLLVAIMLLVMAVGTAMDMTPTILILTPVFMPIIKAAGIDPVYFGVLFMINNAIGLITPPVGTVLSTVAGVGKVSMDEVTRGVWPFMVAQFAVMFLLVLFPSLVLVPARWFYG